MRLNLKILQDGEFDKGVRRIRSVCLLGVIGWVFEGIGLWAIAILIVVINNGWSSRPLSVAQVIMVSPTLLLVIAPILYLYRWHRHARIRMYTQSEPYAVTVSSCPLLVFGISVPGVVAGAVSALLLSQLVF